MPEILTDNYKTFFDTLKLYVKQQADIVLWGNKTIDESTLIYIDKKFVKVSHYIARITHSASSMIYEQYLTDSLDLMYMHKNDLSPGDFDIVLYYFRAGHGLLTISNEEIYADSLEAVHEAQQALYGDLL